MADALAKVDLAGLNVTTQTNNESEQTMELAVAPNGQLRLMMGKLATGSELASTISTVQSFFADDTDATTGKGFATIAGSLNVINNGMSDYTRNTYIRLVRDGTVYGGSSSGPALLYMASVVTTHSTTGAYEDNVLAIIDADGMKYKADFPVLADTTPDPLCVVEDNHGAFGGKQCAFSHISVNPTDSTCCGQTYGDNPNQWTDDTYKCSEEYPYCVGYMYNVGMGYCVKLNDRYTS
jgi:hypothetical protein